MNLEGNPIGQPNQSEIKPVSGEAAVAGHMYKTLSERGRQVYDQLERISLHGGSDDEFDDMLDIFNALTLDDQLDPTAKASETLDARKIDEDIAPISFGGGKSITVTRESNGHYILVNPSSARH